MLLPPSWRPVNCRISQHRAPVPVLALAHLQRRSGGHLKHIPNAILGLGRALQVSKSVDPAGHVPPFLRLYRLLCDSKKRLSEYFQDHHHSPNTHIIMLFNSAKGST